MNYFRPWAVHDWAPSKSLGRTFALRVTPLLRALLHAAFAADVTPEKAALNVRLILHNLIETPDAPMFLPWPASAIDRRVADLAFADGRSRLDVNELASRAATSVRTVNRLFPAETGLTFKVWRQRARIVRAIDRFSKGDAVSRVSADVGFASTATFSVAFRQVTNMNPTEFLDGRREPNSGRK